MLFALVPTSKVALVPRPSVVLCAAASASSNKALPAAVHAISSTTPAPALDLPRSLLVADTFCILAYVTASAAIVSAPPAATVASLEIFPKIASSRFENESFVSVPLLENTK